MLIKIDPSLVLKGIGIILTINALQFLYRFVQVRWKFRRLQAQGIPLIPHSVLLGHLHVLYKLRKSKPADFHPNYLSELILNNWRTLFPQCTTCPPLFYLDLWPLGPPTVFTISPTLAHQSITNPSLSHAESALRWLHPLTLGLDLTSLPPGPWRTWRTRFNPGFAPKNITALIPTMLDEVVLFRDILVSRAGGPTKGTFGPTFSLEELTTNLTFDIISRATLDVRLGEQSPSGPTEFARAMLDQATHGIFEDNIFTLWRKISPARQYRMWRNTRIMRGFLEPLIQKRDGRGTAVVDLAVREVGEDEKGEKEFMDTVVSQLKLFVFAGLDTTSTALCWVLHALGFHQGVGDKVREEVAREIGGGVVEKLRDRPHLLGRLAYTGAVVKETLRFWPSMGVVRDGTGGFEFKGEDGRVYPGDGFMIWDGVRAAMRSEELWVRPNEFLPERWLVGPEHELYPVKNAWRAFGLGGRGCIGQELATVEMKLVVVLVCQAVEMECAWEGDGDEMDGHRCYQTGEGTPHTKDGMPMRVRVRE
ncbi:hypothetical protein OQA88_8988 [Cercophora sp. LCS_1]